MKTIWWSALLLGLVTSAVATRAEEIIRHGTFFGECAGYCVSEIEVSGSTVVYKARFTRPPQIPPVPDKVTTTVISDEVWNLLVHSVDESDFMKLADRYGCPDCADQGGEWIEIRFEDGKQKKVTFDYNRPPWEIFELVKKLQAIQQTFNDRPGILGSAAPIPAEPVAR